MFKFKPDYEAAMKRVNLFWEREETDRPLVSIVFRKPCASDFPHKKHASWEDYWLDLDYRVEEMVRTAENHVYYAEAMPVLWPNLGPEIFSAWAGCPYEFGANTTWTKPCIFDWAADSEKAVAAETHSLFKKVERFTEMLLERGKGNFIVGLTDFHPGGDHVAALRDPEVFATDLLEYPGEIKSKLKTSYDEYFPMYDHFVNMIKECGMPVASWLPLPSDTSMYIPSNDFSCMIGKEMFDEFFLDGLIDECRHYKKSIYHLDGPDALRHLDSILGIEELNAVQWVPGAGRDEPLRWMDVYKKILSSGKGLNIGNVSPSDLDALMRELPAKGLWLGMTGINDEEAAKEVMKKISEWPAR